MYQSICEPQHGASSLPLLKCKRFLDVLTTIRLIRGCRQGCEVLGYSRLLCTAWMPQAARSVARVAQVSKGRWISGNFGYSRLNPWLAAEKGLCAAITSPQGLLCNDFPSLESFLHSPTAVQSVLFTSFYPVLALTAGKADNISSRSGFVTDQLLGEGSAHYSHIHESCSARLLRPPVAVWAPSSQALHHWAGCGRLSRVSAHGVTELCTVWSRLYYSISALPVQKGALVLPKGLAKWKEAVGGWSCTAGAMHCTWLGCVSGDTDAPPRAFSPSSSQAGTGGNESVGWTQN